MRTEGQRALLMQKKSCSTCPDKGRRTLKIAMLFDYTEIGGEEKRACGAGCTERVRYDPSASQSAPRCRDDRRTLRTLRRYCAC
jgi:hypothetical protein